MDSSSLVPAAEMIELDEEDDGVKYLRKNRP
jgi:hypothetical protein